MTEPNDIQILSALQQSGYLFEQEVADRIEALGFNVDTGWAFRDPDLEKSRELDVRGIKRIFHDEGNKLAVFVELLVECKAYENPMVFLQRSKNERELKHAVPKEYLFPVKHFRKQRTSGSYEEVPSFIHLNLRHKHYYYSELLKATQFSKIVRKSNEWTANHEGIYDALILPLTKAFEHQRQDALKRVAGPDWKYVWLFFPMVVLRNGLFSLDVSAKPLEPKAQERVSFVRHLESDKANGFYLIDFVTFSHLGDYLDQEIGPFVTHVAELCNDNPQLFEKPGT